MKRKGPVCVSREENPREKPTWNLWSGLQPPLLLFAASQGEAFLGSPGLTPSTVFSVPGSLCTTEAHQYCCAKSCLELDVWVCFLDYKDLNVIRKCSKGTFLPLVEDILELGVFKIYVCDCICLCMSVGLYVYTVDILLHDSPSIPLRQGQNLK